MPLPDLILQQILGLPLSLHQDHSDNPQGQVPRVHKQRKTPEMLHLIP